MTFTSEQMAKYYGVSKSTLYRHLKKKKFKRTSAGDSFNEPDAVAASKLLGFTIPDLTPNDTAGFKTSFK